MRLRMGFPKAGAMCVLAALQLVLLPGSSLALDPARSINQYLHSVWKVDQGLPHNSIVSVVQSPDGYLWLGTYDGVARFNGVEFRNYRLSELLDLDTDAVMSLAIGRNGRPWAAASAGLAVWTGTGFSRVPVPWNASDYALSVVREDRAGNLWVGTRRGGLWKRALRPDEKWTRVSGLSSEDIRCILEDRDGKIWIATAGGLDFCAGGEPAPPARTIESLRGKYFLSLMQDGSGRIWAGTRDEGLFLLDRDAASPLKLPGGTDPNTVVTMVEDRDRGFWIGTLDGVFRFNGSTFEHFSVGQGLSHGNVRSLCFDREGSLWIGTNGGGLNVLRDGRFVPTTTGQGLTSNVLMSVFEDREGALWLTTNGNGVNRLKDGRVTTLTVREGLSNDNVWSVYEDRQGRVWFGTYGGGVDCLELGRFNNYSKKNGLTADEVSALFVDSEGAMWVGTRGGLNRIAHGEIRTYTMRDGMPHDNVRAIAQDRQGSMWIGTYGGGLAQLRDGRFSVRKKGDGLPGNYVLALYVDGSDDVWIGTLGGGLAVMRRGRITPLKGRGGFPLSAVYAILEDDDGNLWLSNAQGVYRVSKSDLLVAADRENVTVRIEHYTKSDGLPSGGCQGGYQPAAWRGRNGVLHFPTVEGLASIDPARAKPSAIPPPVTIEDIRIQGLTVPYAPDAGAFPPGNGELEFHFAGLSLASPERVRYRYILENQNTDWVEAAPGQRVASYTNIRPGDYRFRVIARSGDGAWNEEGASFAFRIEPHFHQTPWFAMLCFVSIGAAVFVAYRWRVRLLEARQKELSRQVEKALAEIKVLSGLLPICASCKKIRDGGGRWNTLESYISSHSQAEFTHGICPDCMKELYPRFSEPE